MPKYIYQCGICPGYFEIHHGMTEDETNCLQCGSEDFHRVPQRPFLKSSDEPKGGKVGDEVKSAIEANREVLRKLKKDREKEYYRDDN
jgi:putative FmdB family regulatory protein